MEKTNKQWALEYAQMGLCVFPLLPRSKEPAVKDWPQRASKDPDQIESWWNKNPKYGIGAVTGAKSGIVVIDLDYHPDTDGRNGPGILREWEKDNGKLPETWEAETGSGGTHLYFRSTDPALPRMQHLGDKSAVDFQAGGAAIILPPTIHPNGKKYKWRVAPNNAHLAPYKDKPEDFINELYLEGKNGQNIAKFEVPEEIYSGQRVAKLVAMIGSMKSKNFSNDAIEAAVRAENESKCTPPLTDYELEHEVLPALHNLKSSAEQGKPTKEPPKVASVITLCDVEAAEPEWLIRGYMPKYQITTLAGDGGSGKTTIWCSIAAAISSGHKCLLDDPLAPARKPGTVLFFSAEDSIRHTLVKKLTAAGADLSRIISLDVANPDFAEVKFNSDYLKQLLETYRPELCIFDPIQSFVPANIKMGERNAMRQTLEPLIGYGEDYGTTFLIIVHANKMAGAYARKRVADSADIWDISRSVLMVGEAGNGEDYSEGDKYLSQEKCNYGPLQETVIYNLASGYAEQVGTTNKRDREFVLGAQYARQGKPAAQDAKDFILDFIGDQKSVPVSELDEAAEALNIAKGSLRKAKVDLKAAGQLEIFAQGFGNAKKYYAKKIPVDTI